MFRNINKYLKFTIILVIAALLLWLGYLKTHYKGEHTLKGIIITLLSAFFVGFFMVMLKEFLPAFGTKKKTKNDRNNK